MTTKTITNILKNAYLTALIAVSITLIIYAIVTKQ